MGVAQNTRRVLVIGLDAADIELLKLWSDEGSLPVIESLMHRGLWGELKTITDISHTAVWPSIISGTNPGKHGIYNIYQAAPYDYKIFRVKAQQCASPPVWKLLDANGTKCIVIDAPFDCTIDGFHGIQILEWGSWVRYTGRGGNPAAVWDRLVQKCGLPPIENETTAQWFMAEELSRLRDWLLEGIAKKGEAVSWLMQTQDWEFLLAVFPETHPAGHFFWHLHDPHYEAFSEKLQKKLGNYLKDVYRKIDAVIGQIVAGLEERDILLIVSGDRIGPNYSGWHLLPTVLAQLSFLRTKGNYSQDASGGGVSNRHDWLKRLRDRIPEKLRKKIGTALPPSLQFRMWQRWTNPNLDWANTKCFYVPNDCQGHIRINLRGREPLGCVEPGREYDALCLEIKEQFEKIVNPNNSESVVKEVVRTDRLFSGQRAGELPDLAVIWNEDARLTTEMFSDKIGLVKSQQPAYAIPPYYVGNHRGPGFAILHGPGVKAGRLAEDSHIYDIAPTLLAFFQYTIPASMDGGLWHAIDDGAQIKENCCGRS